MKTVDEFKKAGLVFVVGDEGDDFYVSNPPSMSADSIHDDSNVESFAWRENAGVKPEFKGLIDVVTAYKCEYERISPDSAALEFEDDRFDCYVIKWRPSLNQPSIAGPDTKQSAIHKAWVELGGSVRHDFQDAHSIWHVIGANYVNGEYYFSSGDSCFESEAKLVCTVKEFTDYCEKMAAEEKRMDIIGQNGNDGLHYDNTAKQVEALAVNDKPIFTQSMADNGELPPVGSFVDAVGKNAVELFYGEGEVNCEVLAHVENTAVIKMGYGLGCFSSDALKASDARTDREKMHEQIHSIMTDDSGRFMKFSELPDYTIESYDKLIDTFGLLKC